MSVTEKSVIDLIKDSIADSNLVEMSRWIRALEQIVFDQLGQVVIDDLITLERQISFLSGRVHRLSILGDRVYQPRYHMGKLDTLQAMLRFAIDRGMTSEQKHLADSEIVQRIVSVVRAQPEIRDFDLASQVGIYPSDEFDLILDNLISADFVRVSGSDTRRFVVEGSKAPYVPEPSSSQ